MLVLFEFFFFGNRSPYGEIGIVSRFFIRYCEILDTAGSEPFAAIIHELGDVVLFALCFHCERISLIVLHKPLYPEPVRCSHGRRPEPAAPNLAVNFYLRTFQHFANMIY